jgi:hypothetical protein
MLPIESNNHIDDLVLQKFVASEKIGKILKFASKQNKSLIKTASTDNNALINLFTQMLSVLNLKVSDDNVKNVLESLSNSDVKTAIRKNGGDKREEIKIVSKHQKDSHYAIDISKDLIIKNDKKIYMVSCYARDAYLGRYLIKRNYYFTQDREEFANAAYDEITLKMASLKDRYYNDILDVSGIFAQMKIILDGVISEIKSEEDTVGNISR